jgi:Kelch motif/Galactose oxidase, central domain
MPEPAVAVVIGNDCSPSVAIRLRGRANSINLPEGKPGWEVGQSLRKICGSKQHVGLFPLAITQRRTIVALVCLAALLWSWSAFDPLNSQTLPGTWAMKSPLPMSRAEVAALALDGRLHALGGVIDGRSASQHDEYDPATDAWRMRAPLPEPRDHLAVAGANGKIYAFGGFATPVHKDASSKAFAYDPVADTWQVLPAMKVARGAAGAAALDGKIHVIGGRGPDGVVVGAHEIFDTKSDSWSDAPALPMPRDHLVVIAADGKIHVIGGRFKGPADRTGAHDVYDPATNTWTSAAPLPTPRSGLASAYYRGLILVLGGELPPDHTFPENEAYDTKTGQWTSLSRCRMDGTVSAAM